MSGSTYRLYTLFRGILKEFDEYDDEIEFGEIDSKVYNLIDEINGLQPYRDPKLELDYFGISGDVELIFNFKITWMDRESDMEDYLDEVQEVIENSMELLITERQMLGTKRAN